MGARPLLAALPRTKRIELSRRPCAWRRHHASCTSRRANQYLNHEIAAIYETFTRPFSIGRRVNRMCGITSRCASEHPAYLCSFLPAPCRTPDLSEAKVRAEGDRSAGNCCLPARAGRPCHCFARATVSPVPLFRPCHCFARATVRARATVSDPLSPGRGAGRGKSVAGGEHHFMFAEGDALFAHGSGEPCHPVSRAVPGPVRNLLQAIPGSPASIGAA